MDILGIRMFASFWYKMLISELIDQKYPSTSA